MYCLDTNIISFALSDKFNAGKTLVQKNISTLSTTVITQMELLYGAYDSTKINYNLLQINGFLGQIKIYNLTPETIEFFAKEKTRLKKTGQIIEDMDLLIAVVYVANKLILLTDNAKYFGRIENLKLENWVNK